MKKKWFAPPDRWTPKQHWIFQGLSAASTLLLLASCFWLSGESVKNEWNRIADVSTAALALAMVIALAMLVVYRLLSGGVMKWINTQMPALAMDYRTDYHDINPTPESFRGWAVAVMGAMVFAPIWEEVVFRGLPLFVLPGVLRGYGVAMGQVLWVFGHAEQVRPRTAIIRMVHLLPSSLIFLTTMLAVNGVTHNVFVAVAASMLVHFFHNILSFVPRYLTIKPPPASNADNMAGVILDLGQLEG